MGGKDVNDLYFTDCFVPDSAVVGVPGQGRVFAREASMAKLKCTELAKHVTLDGMQMMGGYGYATEYGREALLRETVVSTVYGGTSEIQRDIIGKTWGL